MIHTIHRGQYLQRGRGLGGIFSSIMRALRPIFTKGLTLGRKALSDPDIKEAVSNLKKTTLKTGSRVVNQQMGKIAPPIKPNKKPPKKKVVTVKKAKKRLSDSFNSIRKSKNPKVSSNIFNDFQ